MGGYFQLQVEPFEFDYEFEEEWEAPPANRASRDYVRWVQQSLNQILGLSLSTDGIMGAQTRSASAITSSTRRPVLAEAKITGT